jgi:hypothetical protein
VNLIKSCSITTTTYVIDIGDGIIYLFKQWREEDGTLHQILMDAGGSEIGGDIESFSNFVSGL